MILELTTIFSTVLWSTAATASQWIVSSPADSVSRSVASSGWSVQLDSSWDILGPFPQQAREQHFISPSYPLDVTREWKIDRNKEYPSALADGGLVRWKTANSVNGSLAVMFPDIRWRELRSTEGWAVLQHHALLHSHLTVTSPPDDGAGDSAIHVAPPLFADVRSVSYFTITPDSPCNNYTPEWHTGNIYDLPHSPAQLLRLPCAPARNGSTMTYHIFASGDYEIRLFGDPVDSEGQEMPIQRLKLHFEFEDMDGGPVILEPQTDIVPDFVDGWALAANGALGIGVKAINGWWRVTNVTASDPGLSLSLESRIFRLSPYQSRVIPIRLQQDAPFFGDSISVQITLEGAKAPHHEKTIQSTLTLNKSISIHHKRLWDSLTHESMYKASYFLGGSPLWFTVKPPVHANPESPAILALHGAGVEADSVFWTEAIPRQNSSWIVYPTGRTVWGYDWHGPSTMDVWGSHRALRVILETRGEWRDWNIKEPRVILLGHSNGGQGVWYVASRFPSRVLAAVPASAYVKSQIYVSRTLSRGSQFMDTALSNILESALLPDDNDLYLSNLVSVPILAIHGGNDKNVPTWHSRQLVSDLKSWYSNANISYYEEPGRPHWWDSVLSAPYIQNFLDNVLSDGIAIPSSFTLTTSIPEESDGLHGFRIEQLETPGSLGRLHIQGYSTSKMVVNTTNISEFSLDVSQQNKKTLIVDGMKFELKKSDDTIWLSKTGRQWRRSLRNLIRPSGPLNRIFSSKEPITIVVPEKSPHYIASSARIAHILFSYLKIDSQVIFDRDAVKGLGKGEIGCSNIVILGGRDNVFGQYIMSGNPGAIVFTKQGWKLRGRHFKSPGIGIAFLHSHPTCSEGLTLFMSGTDDDGFERSLRLFPFRSGVAVPDWIITGPEADTRGAGGLLGAGYWGKYWEWNDSRSWVGWA